MTDVTFLSKSKGKMPVQTRIRWYRKGDVSCVPPAESVCGFSVGSHVPLALEKWPQINHMPPRAHGGFPQSAGSKVAHDRTTGLGCTHLVTNHDQREYHESAREIHRRSHIWAGRLGHPQHMGQIWGVPQHHRRNLPDARSNGSLPLQKGPQIAAGAKTCPGCQMAVQCRPDGRTL